MNFLPAFLLPTRSSTPQDQARGRRVGIWQVVASGGFEGITTGGFLVAFALALGASNMQIGILTALPFITQPLQIPAMLLVERLRLRKAIALPAYFIVHSMWIPVALIPFWVDVPGGAAVSFLLIFIGFRGIANAFFSNTWLSWLRDLVPQEILGRFFSQRQAAATLAMAIVGLGAAFYIDFWRGSADQGAQALGYSWAYLAGSILLGWTAVGLMCLIPEPAMLGEAEQRPPLKGALSAPFRDSNFRQLINFLFLWNLASHLAIPFFSVYMLSVLGVPLSAVIGLGVLSQLARIAFVRVWGPLADKFGSKAVLSLSTSLFLLVFLGWTFTAPPNASTVQIPLLVALHIFAGVATAGINLTDMTLRMKLAPEQQATSYLTGASLAINLGAGLSPLLGGYMADFFSLRELTFTLGWNEPGRSLTLAPVHLVGFDFLFLVAFLVGFLTLYLLASVREEGEVDRQVVLDELLGGARESFRGMSTVPGLGFVSHLPYGYLRRVPGVDVALGVTAYEIAASVNTAVRAIGRSRSAMNNVARQVTSVVSLAVEQAVELGETGERQTIRMARHATRGAMHALEEVTEDVEVVTRGAVVGTIRALGRAVSDPNALFWETGFGAVEGAYEVGADVGVAADQAIAGARETAQELGISESEAVNQAVQGVLAAADTLEREPRERIHRSVGQARGDQEGEIV